MDEPKGNKICKILICMSIVRGRDKIKTKSNPNKDRKSDSNARQLSLGFDTVIFSDSMKAIIGNRNIMTR